MNTTAAARAIQRRDFLNLGTSAVLSGLASRLNIASEASGSSLPARVVLARSQTKGAVLPRLAGLSYEKSKLSTRFFTAANTTLVGCFRRLGASMLRIGGNSVDWTTWFPEGPGAQKHLVAPADVRALAAFLRATDWQVIYGINLGSNTLAAAAAEAKCVADTLGTSLYGFEVGNECDLYSWNGIRSKTYTLADFIAEWSGYASAIRQAVPGAVLTGPGSAGNLDSWTIPFASSEATQIELLTQHYYRDAGTKPTSTMSLLLRDHKHLPRVLAQLQTAVASNPIHGGYRLVEANSFSLGGAPNVSDAYGSALWAIDFFLTNAQYGSSGANLHGGASGSYIPPYTPIADDGFSVIDVRPLYYGMLFVAQIPPGPMYSVNVATAINLSAYAIAGHGGVTSIVIVNKDPDCTAAVSIDLGTSGSRATSLLLTGSGLSALRGTTLGGAKVAIDGTWLPTTQRPEQFAGPELAVTVPPVSALLLKVV